MKRPQGWDITLRYRLWEPTGCPKGGYFRAKIAQEKLIKESSILIPIVHATQFLRIPQGPLPTFVRRRKGATATSAFSADGRRRCCECRARIAVGQPLNGIVEIGGPEQFRIDELVRQRLASLSKILAKSSLIQTRATRERKSAIKQLVPGDNARLGETRFETWLNSARSTNSECTFSAHRRRRGNQEREIHKKLADIATAYATGERGSGKVHRRRLFPDTRRDCTTRLQFVRVTWPAGWIPHRRLAARADLELVWHYA